MANPYSLLLDIGGTYVKVAKCSHLDWLVRDEIRSDISPFIDLPQKENKEIDPINLMQIVRSVISQSIGNDSAPESIFITGQMASWILTDLYNSPITNVISWQDNRSLHKHGEFSYFENFSDCLTQNEISEIGHELRPGTSSVNLYALNRMSGINFGERVRFHSMLSWIASQLVRPETYKHIVHTSDAASTGMFNVVNHDWHQEIIESISVEGLTLPEHTSEVLVVGISEEYKSLVFTPIGDQQSALLGIGLKDHQTAFNIATGGQVARVMDTYLPSIQVRPFYGDSNIVTKTHLPAGRALSYAIKLLSPEVSEQESWSWATNAALISRATNELTSDAQFFSESGGGWTGVNPTTTREDMMLSTIRAVADAYISAALTIGHEDGDDLVFCGGVAQKFKPLRDLISGSLIGNVVIAPAGDSALQGLASLVANATRT